MSTDCTPTSAAVAIPTAILTTTNLLDQAIMVGTSSKSPFNKDDNIPVIPIEIVSDEEMFSIEAALSSACCSPVTSAAVTATAMHSPTSVPVQAKRRLFMCAEPDIEDYGNLVATQKKKRVAKSFLHRFRRKRGLSVTDVTSTEWCEKQKEFSLLFEERKNKEAKRPHEEWCSQKQMDFALVYGGQRKRTKEAIRAGIARHVQLEQEVQEQVEVEVKSCEDSMALKLVNFINGVNQLLFEGLTRELPIVGFAFTEGIWMVGVIDEVRMNYHNPMLVETKTRVRDTLPAEPQRRKGRIQLMCYKYLWDNLVADHHFPSGQFFDYFGLNPQRTLCGDLQLVCADSGFPALTLDDLVTCYANTCRMLAPAHDQLLLRYESQKDHTLLGEDRFAYDNEWLKRKLYDCLEFWVEGREATYAAEEEQWKCGYCNYVRECPLPVYAGRVTSNDSSIIVID